MEKRPVPQIARFGIFQVDLQARELHKRGLKVKLQEQPFQVLAALLEHAGEVVPREELRQRIWPADTFVDFDNGLNGAINRLREALGDLADNPRFVETVPRWGYRFIASVEDATPVVAAGAPPSNGGGQAEAASVAKPAEDTLGVARARVRPGSLWGLAPSAGRSLRSLWIVGLAFAAPMALLIGVNAGGMRQRFLGRAGTSPIPSIAVLPFKNLSSEPGSDYFSDGLTDEVIRNLSIIDGLQVKSRTSSFAFKDKPRNIHEVGVQLGANLVLEGSVLRSGDKLRINAQLVRVSDDVPLWSQRFDRELKDIFTIQDEISRGIVNNLRLKLGRGQRRYETSVEAYDLYLRARTPGVFQQRIGLFEEAIAKDLSFAPAYAGLAETYASHSVAFPVEHPSDELAKMRAASEKAIQLDPLLVEAHDTLGVVFARDGQWAQAEKSFLRAIELDPNRSKTYPNYSFWLLTVLGRIEEALQKMRVAERADPLSPDVRGHLAVVLILAGRYSEAAEHCLRLPADYPFKWVILARARLGQGSTDEAIQILVDDQTHLINNPQERGILGYAYARSGRREEAEKMARASQYANEQALIFAGLGDKDRTLEALDRMSARGPVRVGQYLNFPELAFLQGDPRVKVLQKKIGLPE